ncbi:MAG: hypothetical protein ACRDR6_02145 [Pseudonocardiaceae bacterium]
MARRGPDRRTRTGPSNRWRKTTARISALHTRVGNARRDGLRKFTTRLVGMAGNPRKTAIGGNGYRHGKTQTMSQRRHREAAAP